MPALAVGLTHSKSFMSLLDPTIKVSPGSMYSGGAVPLAIERKSTGMRFMARSRINIQFCGRAEEFSPPTCAIDQSARTRFPFSISMAPGLDTYPMT